MKYRSLHIRLDLPVIVLALLSTSGCASRYSHDGGGSAVAVEAPDRTTAMTPAELSRRFRAAHTQGLELARRGQYGLALGAFEEAVSLRPDSVDALFNLGACYDAVGDPLRAVNLYRRVLEITPDDPDCYANLGTSFIKMYHRENSPAWRKMAREAWRHSLRLKPDQADVRRYLALTESLD